MKVRISNYPSWFTTHHLAEKLCFWAKDVENEVGLMDKPEWVYNFGEWLTYGSVLPEPEVGEFYPTETRKRTLLARALDAINGKRKQKIEVKIDEWDLWDPYTTIGIVVRPLLTEFVNKKRHGAPNTDYEDVPEELRPSEEWIKQSKENKDGEVDDKFHERWDWILNEMLFAFNHIEGGPDEFWADEYWGDAPTMRYRKIDEKGMSVIEFDEDWECDMDKIREIEARIENGFKLFGKYFRALWD